MDADKWDDFYERTKESDGMKSAMTDLANGFLRELKSRMEQAGPLDTPREIAQEVDEMWRDVADRHQELDPEGLSQLAKKMDPEVGELFE